MKVGLGALTVVPALSDLLPCRHLVARPNRHRALFQMREHRVFAVFVVEHDEIARTMVPDRRLKGRVLREGVFCRQNSPCSWRQDRQAESVVIRVLGPVSREGETVANNDEVGGKSKRGIEYVYALAINESVRGYERLVRDLDAPSVVALRGLELPYGSPKKRAVDLSRPLWS